MTDRAPENVRVVHQPDVDEYPHVVTEHGPFDVVVVDGRVREDCVEPTLEAIEDDGVVLLDDFERWEADDWARLRESGFRSIPFVGPKAQRLTESCTAVLYRDRNCLGI